MTSSQYILIRQLETVLEIRRRPERHPAWIDIRRPLPEEPLSVMELAALPPDAPQLSRCARQLHASASELRAALDFFIRQVVFAPDADHYRVLALKPGADPDRIRMHYRRLIGQFHPDRLRAGDALLLNYSVRINQAYSVLRDPRTRRAYDALIRRSVPCDRTGAPHPASATRPERPGSTPSRVRCAPLKSLLTWPRRAWQSIRQQSVQSNRQRHHQRQPPTERWRRLGIGVSLAAFGGCLAFVTNSMMTLNRPILSQPLPHPARHTSGAPNNNMVTATRASTAFAKDRSALTPPAADNEQPSHNTTDSSTRSGGLSALPSANTDSASITAANMATDARFLRPWQRPDSTASPTEHIRALQPVMTVAISDRTTRLPPLAAVPDEYANRQTDGGAALTIPEADRLLGHFVLAYETGDIAEFLQLFARQTGGDHQGEPRMFGADYRRLFEQTSERRIAFQDFHWQLSGRRGRGEGRFVATLRAKGEETDTTARGRILLQVEKMTDSVRITELVQTDAPH